MPQIIYRQPNQQEMFEIPPGTSTSNQNLYRTFLQTLREAKASITGRDEMQAAATALLSFKTSSLSILRAYREIDTKEISPTLAQIARLQTWPENWNGYGAPALEYEVLQYAEHWIELFYQEIKMSDQTWIEPNVTASAEGEVVFEWLQNTKGLTIYIGHQQAEFLTDWGANINTEMENGSANSPRIRQNIWKWLVS